MENTFSLITKERGHELRITVNDPAIEEDGAFIAVRVAMAGSVGVSCTLEELEELETKLKAAISRVYARQFEVEA